MKTYPLERRTLGSFLTWRRRRVLVNSLFELLASLITTLQALAPCIVLHTDSTVMQDICVTRDCVLVEVIRGIHADKCNAVIHEVPSAGGLWARMEVSPSLYNTSHSESPPPI